MNKRSLIKFILVILASIISFYFMFNTSKIYTPLNFVLILNLVVAISIFMISIYKKHKENHLFNIALLLLSIFSVIYIIYFIYTEVLCIFDSGCMFEFSNIFQLIYPISLFLMILYSFKDIFSKSNKTNDYLTIIVSILIILIHLRYYFDPNFNYQLYNVASFRQISYYYIEQYYIYFTIMYIIILIHHKANKTQN